MGNIESYKIDYNIYKSKYNSDDYMRLCNSREECQLYYDNTIISLLDTLRTLVDSDETKIINKVINDDLFIDEHNIEENIIEISVKIITYILFSTNNDIDPATINENQFEEAKKTYLKYIDIILPKKSSEKSSEKSSDESKEAN